MNHSRIYRRFAAAAIAVLVLGLMPSVALALPGPVARFTVTGPALVNTGTSHAFTITAFDSSDAVITGYVGTANIVCSDPDVSKVCPVSTNAFTLGVATIDVTLITTATETITATDSVIGTATGHWTGTVVAAGKATHFVVTAPAIAHVGTPASVTAFAKNDSDGTDTTYSGPAELGTTGGGATTFSPVGELAFTAGEAAPFTATFGAVGPHTVTVTDGTVDKLTGASGNIDVQQGTPVITWNNPANITFGTALGATQLNATANVAGTTFVYTPAGGTVLDAGANQDLSVLFTPTDNVNYTTASKTVQINVGTATPTIDWANPADITYGTPLSATQLNAYGGMPGAYTYTPLDGVVLAAGNQALRVDFVPTDTNYSSTFKIVHVDVLPKPITVTADSGQTKVYGASDPTLTYSITAGGPLVGSDALSGSLSRSGSNNVGLHPITQGTLSAGPNYDITFVPANLSITAKPITVTADSGQVKYVGGPNPVYTYQITVGGPALVSGDSFSGVLSRAIGETVGTYAITQGTLSVSANYTLTFVSADFTITDKLIPVITWANPADITYGTALDGTQLDASTVVPGTLTYSPASGTFVGAGLAQALRVDFVPTDTVTYASDFKIVHIKVLPKLITVTADAGQTKVYGTADPTLTYTFDPLVAGDNSSVFTGALSRAAGENVGLHAIALGSLTAGPNYTITFGVAVDFSITAKPITVTADSGLTKAAGAADPVFTYTFSALGWSDNGSVFSGALSRDAGELVGIYAIRQGTLSAGLNYTITFVSANLTVTPGPATHFMVGGLYSPRATGVIGSVTVTALDQFNNTATGYAGTAHITSSDTSATLPANGTFGGGVGSFSVTLRTLGTQSVTATDTVTVSITGSQTGIIVAANAAIPATYHPITPVRMVDSRTGNGLSGKLHANVPQTFQVSGRPGVPSNATAVTGNVTVVNSTNSWAVYLGPDPVVSPSTSTINFSAGEITGNGLTVALSGGGTLSATFISNGNNTTDLTFDVTGYFTPLGDNDADTYHPMTPTRLLDTRVGNGLSSKLPANTPRIFQVAGRGPVPSNAKAVTGNVTVVNSTNSWAVYLGPIPTATPSTSTINFSTGQIKANSLTVALGAGGSLSATFISTAGNTTDLVFDVTGYYTADTGGSKFVPLTPARLLDSRTGNGMSGKLPANTARNFQVSTRGGVPSNASGVTGNVTVVNETNSWAVFVGPTPTNSPSTSTLNFNKGDIKANGLTVALGTGGILSCTYISTAGNTTDLVFDVTGYFVP